MEISAQKQLKGCVRNGIKAASLSRAAFQQLCAFPKLRIANSFSQ